MPKENLSKIICTLGPAADDPEVVAGMLEAGADVIRLNFSHGSPEPFSPRIKCVREMSERVGRHTALLGDLQGPKIRTGELERHQPVELARGQELVITTQPVPGTAERICTTYAALPQDVAAGDCILLDDGVIARRVLSTSETEVRTEVEAGGRLGERKGINLPGVNISSPSLTEKDRRDVEFIVESGLDYVALSCVRGAQEVRELQELLSRWERRPAVIAKIDTPEALAEIEAIVAAADGIMVARGDLGVEMPPEEVPILQKQLVRLCGRGRKPVIVATQMLDSMRVNPRPTRAEASDVAGAIFEGADAVMLSGETAVGRFPVQSVEMMRRISSAAEREIMARPHLRVEPEEAPFISFADALARSVAEVAEAVQAAAIVAFTETGSTARLISLCRPAVPVFAATPRVATARRCSLYWGVRPVLISPVETTDEMIANVSHTMKAMGAVKTGDVIAITAGTVGQAGTTDMVKLEVTR